MNIAKRTARLLAGGIFLWAGMSVSPGWTQARNDTAASVPMTLTPQERQNNLESFEHVWRTIRDKHYDPKLGGLDWQAVHDELRPQMEQADTAAKCRKIISQMIQRLGESHFAIIPRDVYQEIKKKPKKEEPSSPGESDNAKKEDTASGADQAVAGFDVRVVDGQALVVRLDEGLPADKLGVRPGWQILKIDGEDLGPALEKVRAASQGSNYLERLLMTTVLSRLSGKVGASKEIVFRDGDDNETKLQIPLAEPPGTRTQLGHLPTFYVSYETRQLKQKIGYFRLNGFLDPANVMRAFEVAIKENMQAEGFILDLRGNPGGLAMMAIGVGNWFITQPVQKLGTMTTREGALEFVLNRRPETFAGPLAILVDGCSGSTSEILAGGLKDLGRACIFGTPTPGAALPSQFERLPNGDGFQYAFANYISAGGKRLEGNGVRPDQEIVPNRTALLAGGDAILDAAVAWVQARKK